MNNLSIIFLSYSYTHSCMPRIEPNENWSACCLTSEFLRKTKTPQNDSGTIIAWHIVNLNPSLHVYQHFKTEIRRAKLIYTARTIVERGILPTVSKTHFTPLEKKTFPRKKAAWWDSKSKWVVFLRWYRKQKNRVAGRARGSRKMANFYARKVSRGSFRYKKTAPSDETGENSARPLLRSSPVRIPPGSSVSPVAWVDRAARQQLSSCAASAHGLWANWCSISIHPAGDLLRVISMTSSSSSSVHGLLDQLLWRGRHFVQSGYCGTISDAWEEYRRLRRWKEKRAAR